MSAIAKPSAMLSPLVVSYAIGVDSGGLLVALKVGATAYRPVGNTRCSMKVATASISARRAYVYQYMPQQRRTDWNEQIKHPAGVPAPTLKNYVERKGAEPSEWKIAPLPDFEEPVVSNTLRDLLLSREKFFAERVDGIFRALSQSHVTNEPQGFGRRMIIAGFITSYDTLDHNRAGYIADLRSVIAKFMGRDDPNYRASEAAYRTARERRGQWQDLDGGALRLRAYKCGTAHLEVNPEIAWRLNNVLAFLHPAAIPSEFCAPPRRKAKDFALFDRPLPFAVVGVLAEAKEATHRISERPERWTTIPNCAWLPYVSDKELRRAVERVMISLGGSETRHGWQFDYEPLSVIQQVVCTGRIPDQQSHQFFPTPDVIAAAAAALAQIGPHHTVLEPGAGHGDLADYLPKEQTTCVEVSGLHCAVLKAKRYPIVIEADFLAWADDNLGKFDRVVLNPPFSDGRWQLHVERGAACLNAAGRLVAILPASAHGKTLLRGWDCEWSEVYENEFAGTSVSVAIVKMERCRPRADQPRECKRNGEAVVV